MSTCNKTNYFYIGLFTLVGLFMLIASLVILGSKASYKNAVYVETYFDESVQGLTVGSPVKYRGMEVGKIIDIAPVTGIYNFTETASTNTATNPNQPSSEKYIYVKMAINTKHFRVVVNNNDLGKDIEREVKNGLRIKTSAQGLTGSSYLELDYVDPDTHKPLPIAWKPINYYIPSTPSTLAFFSDNAQHLVDQLKKAELQKTFAAIKKLAESSKQTFDDADKLITSYNNQTAGILTNLQITIQNLKIASEQAKNNPSSVLFGNPPPKLDPNKF